MKRAKRNSLLVHLDIHLDVRNPSASLPRSKALRRWARAALQANVREAQIGILIVDEHESRKMNRDYRGKDYATNVLSFVLNDREQVPGLPLIGDLVLCAPVVSNEAIQQNKPLQVHYAHLLVHGMLHLQGFDHEEDGEAETMEALERSIMHRLGYPDPYREEQL